MKNRINFACLGITLVLILSSGATLSDPVHRLTPGDTIPTFELETIAGDHIDRAAFEDKVLVLIYVIANQRGSERAIADASKVVKDLADRPIGLLFVTANAGQSAYFEAFWKEKGIHGTLAFDADRTLYSQLGLIAFPTTLIVNPKGELVHLLSTHSPNYPYVLESYIRHALGLLDDVELAEHLKARSLPTSSPKSIASRHRTAARLLREKGMFDAAEKELNEAIKYDPESPDIRLDLAELYLSLDRLSDASEMIEQVQKINPDHRHAMLLKGILLFRQGDYNQAQRILTEALVLNPDPARTHYYLGRIYEAQGEKDSALDHYRRALGRLLDEPIE